MLAWTKDEDQDHSDAGSDEREGDEKERIEKVDDSSLFSRSRPWLWITLTWTDVINWGLIYTLVQWIYWLSLWLHSYQGYHHNSLDGGWKDTQSPSSSPHKLFFFLEFKQMHSSHTSATYTFNFTTLATPLILVYIVSGVVVDGLAWLGSRLLLLRYRILWVAICRLGLPLLLLWHMWRDVDWSYLTNDSQTSSGDLLILDTLSYRYTLSPLLLRHSLCCCVS